MANHDRIVLSLYAHITNRLTSSWARNGNPLSLAQNWTSCPPLLFATAAESDVDNLSLHCRRSDPTVPNCDLFLAIVSSCL